jgi:hypothetical protein
MKIGIIAEDDSDVGVLRELTLTLLKRPMGFSRFVGDGCGKLRRKCGAWAINLVRQGCPWIVLVHDLDQNDEKKLRAYLTGAIKTAGAKATVVLIPKKEIEAWLLYDARAIAQAFREQIHPQLPGKPESLPDPKKFIRDLVWKKYRKNYLNTVHNAAIARHIDPSRLNKSDSFAPHLVFVKKVKGSL